MTGQIKLALKATKVFFFVRFVTCVCIGLLYILVAANVQYLFVKLLGESTFNYIIGGILSLVAGAAVCGVVGDIVFLFIRGWHIAAIAYSRIIIKKNYGALDAGMTIFRKHFTSFVVVWGVGTMVRRASKAAISSFWDLLRDIPFLNSLKKFAQNPFVAKVAQDILNTAFDALVYYEIKYTEPGIADDAEVIGIALKKYLLSLPQTIIGSFLSLVMLYILPRIMAVLCLLYAIVNEGLVAGILISVLLYPLFYLLNHTLFEPFETIMLISGFAKQCVKSDEEESESPYLEIVASILEDMGLGELGVGEDEDSESGDAETGVEETNKPESSKKPKKVREAKDVQMPIEPAPAVKPVVEVQSVEDEEVIMAEEPNIQEIMGYSASKRSINDLTIPLSAAGSGVISADIFKDERVKSRESPDASDVRAFSQRASARDISQSILNNLQQTFSAAQASPVEEPAEESAPANIFAIIEGMDEEALARELETLDDASGEGSGNQQESDNTLGGGNIDIF